MSYAPTRRGLPVQNLIGPVKEKVLRVHKTCLRQKPNGPCNPTFEVLISPICPDFVACSTKNMRTPRSCSLPQKTLHELLFIWNAESARKCNGRSWCRNHGSTLVGNLLDENEEKPAKEG